MRIEKAVLQKTVEKLSKRADDCFDAAQAQHASADKQEAIADQQKTLADQQQAAADKQRANAEKLETLGQALEADAVTLNGELEMVAQRPSYRAPRSVLPLEPAVLKPGQQASGPAKSA